MTLRNFLNHLCVAILLSQVSYTTPLFAQGSGELNIVREDRAFQPVGERKYLRKEKIPESVKEEVQSVESDSAAAYIRSGKVKADKSDWKPAHRDFDRALIFDNNNVEALFCRGVVKDKMEDAINAISDYSQAIELDKLSTSLYFLRGNDYFLMGNFDLAVEDYTSALNLDATDKVIYFNRAVARIKLGETEKACTDLKFAARLGYKEAGKLAAKFCTK